MVPYAQKKDKQLIAENIWLHHFNNTLYRNGIITADAYRKMIYQINNRTKTTAQKKGEQ